MSAAKTVALSDVAVIEREIIDSTAIETGTLYVGLENIESGGRFVGVRQVDAGELASSKFAFTPQHLLYGKLRPYLAKIARPDFEGICSTDILPVLPGPDLDRSYLAWLLLAPEMVALANSRATGANLPRLSPTALAELRIPLPPLPEQRRIAEILDKADALRAKRRAALAQLDTLTQSIFLDMFGDPATNPKGWPDSSLGPMLLNVTNGMTRRRPQSDEGQSIVLRLRDIREGWIDFSDVNRITLTENEARKYEVTAGDLLFIRVNGNPEYVGRCALFDGFAEKVYFNDHVMRVRADPSTVAGIFLTCLLNSSHGKREIAKHRKTSAGQHTINQEGLGRIRLPVPPLPLQVEFGTRISAIEKANKDQAASLSTLDALFAALQHRAFRGEL